MTYKAFISYSHAADGKLAPLLQSGLHRFAKPFLRMRAMRVFRDATSLHLTPALWPTIQKALHESEHFILMASPEAAKSDWVREEVKEWLGGVSFPDPDAGSSREFAWDVSLAIDSTTARRLSELATLLFGARIGVSGAVEPVIAPEAHELAARFKDSALAALAMRAVDRATPTHAVATAASARSFR